MALLQALFTTFTLGVFLAIIHSTAGQSGGVEPNCLGCLCEAATSCNASMGCSTPYPGGYFCGPFLISWAYWSDAGKPVIQNDDPERKGAFENCVTDLICAAETVRRYMKKFEQDCTNDGAITCADYSRIHKLGGYACSSPLDNSPFWTLFQQCAVSFSLN